MHDERRAVGVEGSSTYRSNDLQCTRESEAPAEQLAWNSALVTPIRVRSHAAF